MYGDNELLLAFLTVEQQLYRARTAGASASRTAHEMNDSSLGSQA